MLALIEVNGYLFGAAAAEEIDKDPAYRDLYVTQTKIITTDVALKMKLTPHVNEHDIIRLEDSYGRS